MPYEPILWGIALAATAGLRLFMPFVFIGGLARYAHVPAPEMLGWTASDAGFLLLPGFEFTDFDGLRAGIASTNPGVAASVSSASTTSARHGNGAEHGLEVVASQAIYRTDGVTRRASALQAHPLTVGPRAVVHPDEAARVGVADGAMAKLGNEAGTATLQVVVDDRVAPGCVWIESGYGATAPLASARVEVRPA